jgi:hypothetical protein
MKSGTTKQAPNQNWECECDTNYIDPAIIDFCEKYKAKRRNQPDAIVLEVIVYGFGYAQMIEHRIR